MENKIESTENNFKSNKQICEICRLRRSVYTCPKCNIPFCTLNCYRNIDKHVTCSENFYHDQILTELKNMNLEMDSKNEMAKILLKEAKKCERDNLMDNENLQENQKENKVINEDEMIKFYERKIIEWVPWWRNQTLKEPLLQEIDNESNKFQLQAKLNANLVKNSSSINVSNANQYIYNEILQMCYNYIIIANIYQLNENDLNGVNNVDKNLIREIACSFVQLENILKSVKTNDLKTKFDLIVKLLQEESGYFLRSYINGKFLIDILDELVYLIEWPEVILHILSQIYDMFESFIKLIVIQKSLLDKDINDKLDSGKLELEINEDHLPMNVFHLNKTNENKEKVSNLITKSKRVEIIKHNKPKEKISNISLNDNLGKKEAKIFLKKIEFFFKWLSENKQSIKSFSNKQEKTQDLKLVKQTIENELEKFDQERKFIDKNLNKIKAFEKKNLIEEIN